MVSAKLLPMLEEAQSKNIDGRHLTVVGALGIRTGDQDHRRGAQDCQEARSDSGPISNQYVRDITDACASHPTQLQQRTLSDHTGCAFRRNSRFCAMRAVALAAKRVFYDIMSNSRREE
eukprot:6384252-Amphidinium_carterae.1